MLLLQQYAAACVYNTVIRVKLCNHSAAVLFVFVSWNNDTGVSQLLTLFFEAAFFFNQLNIWTKQKTHTQLSAMYEAKRKLGIIKGVMSRRERKMEKKENKVANF